MKKITLLSVVLVLFMSSCTHRIIDFTVISTKNLQMSMDKSQGKQVKIKDLKAFGINATLKGAIDKALNTAGPGYDMLVDGVISVSNYYFVAGYRVEGLAINTLKLKSELGEEGFQQFIKEHSVVTPQTQPIQN
ncbi:MAG TPA: hypothetical protein VG603_12170 [Chitinophagales bacterium]|nr:hypothetical protein [Chitinophagales bacterium]